MKVIIQSIFGYIFYHQRLAEVYLMVQHFGVQLKIPH